jgi:hypothetical protein
MLKASGLSHPEPFHDSARSEITHSGEGHDFSQSDKLEANMKRSSCRLRRETTTPVSGSEPPANLDAGRKREFGVGYMQPNKTHELAGIPFFNSPQTPTALSNQKLATVGHGIACGAIKQARKELHHFWVRVHRGEWLAVSLFPLAQTKT